MASRTDDANAARVRNLIALDSAMVMRRLASRRHDMIATFSRKRDRRVLIEAVHTWFDTARFDELVLLEIEQQTAATQFYEQLDDLRYYFKYTEDMPGTAERALATRLKRLERAFQALAASLGKEKPARAARPVRKRKTKTTAKKKATKKAKKTTRRPGSGGGARGGRGGGGSSGRS